MAGVFDDLLQKLIGSQTNTNVDEQLGVKNLINSLQQGTQQTTGNTTNTSTVSADNQRLGDVYARQAAGVTPEMLQGIFREGAKAAPQLVTNTANAVGARSSGNSPLATAFNELNTNLVGQAAQLNASMLRDAGTTAGQIGALTKQTTDTATQNQNVASNQNNATDQTQNSTKASDTVARTAINAKSSAITAGVAGLLSLLQGSGANASTISSLLAKLFGNGGSGLTIGDSVNAGFGDGTGLGGDYTTPTFGGDTSGVITGMGGLFGWADGGLVGVPKLDLNSKKATGPTDSQLLALTNGSGFSFASGSTGASGSGSDSGGSSSDSSGTTDSSSPSSVGSVSTASNQQAINGMLSVVGMIPGLSQGIAVGKALQNLFNPTIPSMLPANIQFDPSSLNIGINASGPGTPGAVGGVTAGPATAADAATGAAVGVEGAMGEGTSTSSGIGGIGNDGTGSPGDGPGSGDGTSGGGWAAGGLLPPQADDPKGNKDTMLIPASGGEYVMPTDVMQIPGMHAFMETIRNSFHKSKLTTNA